MRKEWKLTIITKHSPECSTKGLALVAEHGSVDAKVLKKR